MTPNRTRKLATLAALVVAAATLLATPASASTFTNTTIAPGSSITLDPNVGANQTFVLGSPPAPGDPVPPASCGIPTTWTPSKMPVTFNNDAAPTTVSSTFAFNPGAANVTLLGWKRVEISGTTTGGTVNPTTGAVSLTANVTARFRTCSSGYPLECTITTPMALTGTLTGIPVTSGTSTATLSGSGTLTTSGCSGLYVLALSGATASTTLNLAITT